MRKRIRLILIIVCISVLAALRILSKEDTRICEGNTLVKHGNPSVDGSGFFCSWGKLLSSSSLSLHPAFMKITSDFSDNGSMPSLYTCDSEWRFPVLHIHGIPSGTKSLALIVYDPDAPAGVRDHLLLANIPLAEEGVATISQDTFDTGILGENSRWEQARWAPCPPSGTHRYVFKVYALSDILELSAWFSKERLLEMFWWKITDQAQLVGLYKRY